MCAVGSLSWCLTASDGFTILMMDLSELLWPVTHFDNNILFFGTKVLACLLAIESHRCFGSRERLLYVCRFKDQRACYASTPCDDKAGPQNREVFPRSPLFP